MQLGLRSNIVVLCTKSNIILKGKQDGNCIHCWQYVLDVETAVKYEHRAACMHDNCVEVQSTGNKDEDRYV